MALKERLKQGWIHCAVVVEILGKPKEYISEVMEEVANAIGKAEGVELVNKKVHEPHEMKGIEKANLFPKAKPVTKVFIATIQADANLEAAKLAKQLRERNIPTQIDLKERSLSKQLEYVNASGIPYMIVLGRRELESRIVRIKNMSTRQETETALDEVGRRIEQLG